MSDIEDNKCPYSINVAGVSICMLNVLPCERVSRKLCERLPINHSGIAGEGEVIDDELYCKFC